MTLKLFRAAWFLSVLVVLANLLFVYAGWPELVVVQEYEQVSISKEWLFYIFMMSIVAVNVLVYVFKVMFQEGENLRAWFHGVVITINIFLVVALQALHVYNGNELFDHEIARAYLTGSLGLILVWAAVWPIYLMFQKFFVKQAV